MVLYRSAVYSPGPSYGTIFVWACTLLLFLWIVVIQVYREKIQNHLSTAVARELQQHPQFSRIAAEFSGRDAILRGVADNEKTKSWAVEVTEGVRGVRKVVANEVSIRDAERAPTPESTPRTSPPARIAQPTRPGTPIQSVPYTYIRAEVQGGRVLVEGRLPTDDVKTEFLDAVRSVYPETEIIDHTEVAQTSGDYAWNLELVRNASKLSDFRPLMIDAQGPVSSSITYRAEDERTRSRLRTEAAKHLPRILKIRVFASVTSEEDQAAMESLKKMVDDIILIFSSGQSGLDERMKGQLAPILTALQKSPAVRIRVEGHSDSSGRREVNRRLSRNRAVAVHDYLVAQGVDPERLTVVAHGETHPLGDNRTSEGRARNRRVELEVDGDMIFRELRR